MLRDRDIRGPLFDYLEELCGRVRIIEEKMIGRSRADVVMVMEDALCGIEIKSDADTYARLKSQVRDYDLTFDYNIAAVGASHAHHIEEHVPAHWGIITIDEDGLGSPDFYLLRRPARNDSADMMRKLRILWRPELARILERSQLPAYRGKSKEFVRKKLADMLPSEVLDRLISEELFERDYTTIAREIELYKEQRASSVTHKRRPKRRRLKKA